MLSTMAEIERITHQCMSEESSFKRGTSAEIGVRGLQAGHTLRHCDRFLRNRIGNSQVIDQIDF
jgi:hypothetical protein